jgi:hypothetical protein
MIYRYLTFPKKVLFVYCAIFIYGQKAHFAKTVKFHLSKHFFTGTFFPVIKAKKKLLHTLLQK